MRRGLDTWNQQHNFIINNNIFQEQTQLYTFLLLFLFIVILQIWDQRGREIVHCAAFLLVCYMPCPSRPYRGNFKAFYDTPRTIRGSRAHYKKKRMSGRFCIIGSFVFLVAGMVFWLSWFLVSFDFSLFVTSSCWRGEREGRERGGADMSIDIERLLVNGRWSLLNILLCTCYQWQAQRSISLSHPTHLPPAIQHHALHTHKPPPRH